MKRTILFGTALLALVATGAPAFGADAPLPKGVEKVASVEGITEYRLGNGLRVLMFPDTSKQTTTVNITYLVGSRHENYGETGMAHLLEHMQFKGSAHHPNIPQELTSHGARTNASTWFDRTNYYETFATSDLNLDWALDLEADRMVNSFMKKSDLWGPDGKSGEMTVVRNEFEKDENDPAGVLQERLLSTAYLWHHYGNSTIGARSDVENVPIDRLKDFYQRFYQPDNAVLTLAGKFDESKALALVAAKLGAVPKPTRVLEKTWTAEPTQDGERTVTLRRTGDTQELAIGYHTSAGSSPEFPALDLLAYSLGDSPSGRLYKALVETKKASSVGFSTMQFKEPGMAVFSATLRKEDKLEDAKQILTKVVEDAAKNPPTAEEIERGRSAYLKQIDLSLRNSERVGLQLSEWIAMGDWRLFFLYRDQLKKTTPKDVAAVAAKYLKSSNRTTAEFIPTEKPDRAEVAAAPDVDAMVKNYKGGVALAQGEAFDPSTSNVETRTHRSTIGPDLKVALLSKKTRGSSVYLNLTLRLGDEKSLFGKGDSSGLAGSMLMRGTKKHTRQQLTDLADKLKARINVDGGAQTAYATIETDRDNLAEAFKLAVEILREPAFPASEFETLKAEELAGIEEQRSDPTARGQNVFQRHMYPYPKGDVRYVQTPEEQIADLTKATLDEAKSFHKEYYGASNGELAVVGDFDEKAVLKLAKDLLGNWKSPKPYKRLESVFKDVAATNESIETPDKTSAFWTSGQRIAMRDDDQDFPAMILGNYMLGGGFLNSRLATRIRQKDGLSYGVGSGFSANPFDKDAYFGTYAIYAPQNVEKLEKAFAEEIQKVLDSGFTADEIAQAKTGWLQGREVARSNDGELVRGEGTHLYYGRTYKWDADYEKRISELTAEQIQSAMKRHMDLAKMSIVKAGDFAGAKAGKTAPEETGKSGGVTSGGAK